MIKIDTSGLSVLAGRMKTTEQRLSKMDGVFQQIGTRVFRQIARTFNASGSFEGRDAWKPLAISTLAWKRKHGYSSKPLIRTGDLRQHWDIQLGTNKVTVISAESYSGFHEHGTKRIPARPFLPTKTEATALAIEAFSRHVRGALTGVTEGFRIEST